MFTRNHRLAKQKDLSETYARGRGFFSPYFSLKVFYKNQETAKFAIVVSNKVSKRATARNRLRRLAREYVRKHIDLFRPGNYIVTIKPSVNKLAEPEYKDQLAAFFGKLSSGR